MLLSDLVDRTGLDVHAHLERQLAVPVVDGLQAQGDLLVLPIATAPEITVARGARWRPVPRTGVELVRGGTGANPHTLVADEGTCSWTADVRDPLRLAIAVFDTTAAAYLVHPEHGGNGVAPGRWVVRRQRERATGPRRTGRLGDGSTLVVD